MSEHRASIRWRADGGDFIKGRFSRAHTWTFDGGVTVPASAAPAVVRPPLSSEEAVDPEEAFVASISSCHMLTFLYLAAKQGFDVTSYEDDAVGTMGAHEGGSRWVSRVVLWPRIEFGGESKPNAAELAGLHDAAHHACFIANSVKTEITIGKTEG
jgi:organic hydroperoxide reductase OsmC/OhrA